jgi:PAS domain S-box-containing protein
MPGFGAEAALAVLRQHGARDLPFIIVSGTIGEDVAVAAMRAGAQDFLLKDRLGRLGAAVEREVREWRTRAELRKRRDEADRFFNLTLDLLCVSSHAGAFERVNPAWQATLGYAPEELHAHSWTGLAHPDDRGAMEHEVGKLVRGSAATVSFENRYACRDGTYRYFLWTAIASPREQRIYATGRDVTDRKRAEDELLRAQKMEAIGRLTGGVAHDFNNMLAVILTDADLALEAIDEQHPARADLEEIVAAARRGAVLTRQLLGLGRRQVFQPRALSINTVVADVEKLLRRVIGEDIMLSTVLAPDVGMIEADPGQLEQVLLNLVVNARDAMPEGGELVVRTGNADLTAEQGERAGVSPGAYVRLTVKDTGAGMSASTLARIFEPFFTTKEAGKSTGLGLSTVWGIARQAGGGIAVDSTPGAGATFEVYFPSLVAGPSSVARRGDAEVPVAGGAETVLLVEDDEQLRGVVRRVLGGLGYRVIEARNGSVALEAVSEAGAPPDLVVTDLIMPDMDGRALASRMKDLAPRAAVLFMSGYAEHAAAVGGALPRGQLLIQKPFTPQQLARAARRALDARGAM